MNLDNPMIERAVRDSDKALQEDDICANCRCTLGEHEEHENGNTICRCGTSEITCHEFVRASPEDLIDPDKEYNENLEASQKFFEAETNRLFEEKES